MTAIYIDCTDLCYANSNTGIQRVERNIIRSAIELSESFGVTVIPVAYLGKHAGLRRVHKDKDDGLWKLGYFEKVYLSCLEPKRLRLVSKAVFPAIAVLLERYWDKIRYLLLPVLVLILPLMCFLSVLVVFCRGNSLKLEKGDVYFIPGPSWWVYDLKQQFVAVKSVGAKIMVLLHDIIAIDHPDYCDNKLSAAFSHHIETVLAYSDTLFFDSEYTKTKLKAYFLRSHIGCSSELVVNYPGFSIDLVNSDRSVRSFVSSATNDAYIAVSTLEPRKNHQYLLDAFDLIWHKAPNVKLCIIGKYGWKSEKMVERIVSHPYYGKQLFWFEDLDDNELLYAYRNAKACIYPSIVEGFGLPLIEALSLGCPVFASDIPVFHEVAGDCCQYFSLDEQESLVNLIVKDQDVDADAVSELNSFSWPDWKQSTSHLLKHMIK